MSDTIAAVSTAFGEGGIGIIRMSGPDSLDVLKKIFVPASGKEKEPVNRMMTYGKIVDPELENDVDEVMAVYMKAPHTYTREDVVEIDSHGSVVSLRKILSLCYRYGARPAERGEFTKLAFLNGRLDLSQAESVMDLVSAGTDSAFDSALSQLEGKLSREVKKIRADIMDILVDMVVNIDYPDEDIEELIYDKLIGKLSDIRRSVGYLLDSANTGRIIREGLKVSIIGRPNVGKSSLMNALLKESRAIVTDIPGTTRDTIEEAVSIRNIPVILTDTAGIRETDDTIEKIGIEKSRESFNESDLVILMIDASQVLEDEDISLMKISSGRKTVLLANKTDKGVSVSENEIRKYIPDADIIFTSMKEEGSVSKVEDKIESLVYEGDVSQESSLIITNARHEDLLRKASDSLDSAVRSASEGEALEIVEIDVHEAYDRLGEIIGESVSDDIIDEVFSRFCLGK